MLEIKSQHLTCVGPISMFKFSPSNYSIFCMQKLIKVLVFKSTKISDQCITYVSFTISRPVRKMHTYTYLVHILVHLYDTTTKSPF